MEKKKLILLLLSCAVITEAHAAYQGRVYVDSNRNGIYDKGEKVLKGIRVSDGLNVVKTNAEGVYALPGHERERFIFITTPSAFVLTTFNPSETRMPFKTFSPLS